MESQAGSRVRAGSSAVEKAFSQLATARDAYERAHSEALILRHAGLRDEAERRVRDYVDPALDYVIQLEESVMLAPVGSIRDLARKISIVAANDFEAPGLNELLAANAEEILKAA